MKFAEVSATRFMKLEFEHDYKRLGEEAIAIKMLWWNDQYNDWEESGEVLLPLDRLDEIINILKSAKG